ncbi:hypothetical protein LTR86_002919 [Recurvomyces mirabilis]|nr:hypothetical protein LTR86_002919 [Recurvomyces mirabilis]
MLACENAARDASPNQIGPTTAISPCTFLLVRPCRANHHGDSGATTSPTAGNRAKKSWTANGPLCAQRSVRAPKPLMTLLEINNPIAMPRLTPAVEIPRRTTGVICPSHQRMPLIFEGLILPQSSKGDPESDDDAQSDGFLAADLVGNLAANETSEELAGRADIVERCLPPGRKDVVAVLGESEVSTERGYGDHRPVDLSIKSPVIMLAECNASLTTSFPHNTNKAAAVVEIATLCIVGLTYCWSNGSVPPVITSEISPQHVRDKALGILLLGQTSCLLAITQPWPQFNNEVGAKSYWLLFGLNVLALVSVIVVLPETKGVSLERMDKIFGQVDAVEGSKQDESKEVAGLEARGAVGATGGDREKDLAVAHVQATFR